MSAHNNLSWQVPLQGTEVVGVCEQHTLTHTNFCSLTTEHSSGRISATSPSTTGKAEQSRAELHPALALKSWKCPEISQLQHQVQFSWLWGGTSLKKNVLSPINVILPLTHLGSCFGESLPVLQNCKFQTTVEVWPPKHEFVCKRNKEWS